jgi:phage gp36-like protein
MAYALVSDIDLFGIPAQALGPLSTLQKQAALDGEAATMDSYFRGRYTLPFLTYGVELTKYNVWLAQFQLMNQRGYAPNASADKNIKDRYDLAMKWLIDVRDQKVHPDVTDQTTKTYDQPIVLSTTPFVPKFSGKI